MNHHCSVKIDGFDGSLEELARLLASLRYDKVVEFLESFESAIVNQSTSDEVIGRDNLALLLCRAKHEITALITTFQNIIDDQCNTSFEAERGEWEN